MALKTLRNNQTHRSTDNGKIMEAVLTREGNRGVPDS